MGISKLTCFAVSVLGGSIQALLHFLCVAYSMQSLSGLVGFRSSRSSCIVCCSRQNGCARQKRASSKAPSNGPAAEAEQALVPSPSPEASQKPKRQKRAPRKASTKALGSSPTAEAEDAQATGTSPAVQIAQAQAPGKSPAEAERAIDSLASPETAGKPKRKYIKSGKFVGKFNSWKKKQGQAEVANTGVNGSHWHHDSRLVEFGMTQTMYISSSAYCKQFRFEGQNRVHAQVFCDYNALGMMLVVQRSSVMSAAVCSSVLRLLLQVSEVSGLRSSFNLADGEGVGASPQKAPSPAEAPARPKQGRPVGNKKGAKPNALQIAVLNLESPADSPQQIALQPKAESVAAVEAALPAEAVQASPGRPEEAEEAAAGPSTDSMAGASMDSRAGAAADSTAGAVVDSRPDGGRVSTGAVTRMASMGKPLCLFFPKISFLKTKNRSAL